MSRYSVKVMFPGSQGQYPKWAVDEVVHAAGVEIEGGAIRFYDLRDGEQVTEHIFPASHTIVQKLSS